MTWQDPDFEHWPDVPQSTENNFCKSQSPWRWVQTTLKVSKPVCIAIAAAIVCCSGIIYDQAGESGLEEHCY